MRLALVVIWVVEDGEGGADDSVAFQGQVSVVDERWDDLSPAAVGLFYEVVGNAEFSRPEFSGRADGILVRGVVLAVLFPGKCFLDAYSSIPILRIEVNELTGCAGTLNNVDHGFLLWSVVVTAAYR